MVIITSIGDEIMHSKRVVAAATDTIGTTYYHMTENDVEAGLKSTKSNIIIQQMFKDYGWDCLNFSKNLFGSKVIDGDLYLCVTDGQIINVDDYEVDPERALEDLELDELYDYIEEATPEVIHRYITPFELKQFDLDKLTEELLDEGYTLKQVWNAAQEAELV